ncbi:MAG: YigZ family protein [Chitinophagaceae bacterium]|nr:MAG: YigZ family protein [Chitinophagaceae bacterium]
MNEDSYHTIKSKAVAEFKDRGSKFIAIAFPIITTNDFKVKLKAIKEEHPKASHFCFAYRLGTDGIIFRYTDAGEPSGSAGKPILNQIDSFGVTNIALVVTRYFGGSLLGIPGLINAYKTSASLVLQTSHKIKMPILVNYILQFNYTKMNEVMIQIKKYNCVVLKKESTLFCEMNIGIQKSNQEICLLRFKEITGLSIEKESTKK